MTYMKILIELIDPNPFQTRQAYDDGTITGIALSALGRHGLLQAPMVRPYNDRYQIAFGHGRVKAMKALGKKKVECRVEDMTDEEMKKYVLQENVLRSDLSEEERMVALEQYRAELKEKKGREPTFAELSEETGIPRTTINFAYLVKETRIRLKNDGLVDKEPKADLILRTRGLDPDIQDKLILKSLDMGWSSDTAFKVKAALKEMDAEIRDLILDDKTRLPHKVITALAELETEKQKKALKHIKFWKLNEKDAIDYIDKLRLGLVLEEHKEVTFNYFDRIEKTFYRVRGWGIPMVLAMGQDEWDKSLPYVKGINDWTNFLLKIKGDTVKKPPTPPKLELEVDEKKIIEAEYTIIAEDTNV